MTTNKKRGWCFIAAGAMLLIAALSLVLWNNYENKTADESAKRILAEIEEQFPELKNTPVSDNDDSQQETEIYDGLEQDDKSVELDGNWYIGVIKIPAINLELPVLRDWSYKNLDIAPCHYSGGSARGNLVIAAHNYSSFFKRLKELNSGDEIIFTNLSGFSRIYEVDYIEFVNGYDVDSMLAGSENWDLTLFTCTWSGYSRVTVRAVETVDK